MNLSSVISLSKLFILRYNWKHTYSLVKSVADDWSTVKDIRHRRVMMEYFQKGKIVSTMMLYLGYASGISFIVKALPLQVFLPIQVELSQSACLVLCPRFTRSGCSSCKLRRSSSTRLPIVATMDSFSV